MMASGTGPALLRYADLWALPEDQLRHEIIAGRHYISPSPIVYHQQIVRNLVFLLAAYEQHAGGRMLLPPVDVVLSDENVVIPYLVYVSEPHLAIVTERCVRGAPDLVVEVLSPGSAKNDRTLKLRLYEQYGVGEYWLVDPQLKQLMIFGRDRQKFTPHNFDLAVDPVALSHALTGFQPRLAEIFRER